MYVLVNLMGMPEDLACLRPKSPPHRHGKLTACRLLQGHFQIVLSNEHCPLFQKDLSWFQRMMYCSGVWAYIVGATTTPMFIIIPLVRSRRHLRPMTVVWDGFASQVLVVLQPKAHVVVALCVSARWVPALTSHRCCTHHAVLTAAPMLLLCLSIKLWEGILNIFHRLRSSAVACA